jgi:hypothetical protein
MDRRWVVGLAVVTLGWLASPGATAVYDGVGAPDQPYRYVGTTPQPGSATAPVTVSGGKSGSIQVRTDENGPQALIDLAAGAFDAATDFSLTVTPLAADTTPPRGKVDGNVYRIAVTSGATLQADNAQGYLFLRAAVMTKPAPVIAYRATATDPWVEQPTNVNGQDNVNTPLRKVGDYLVVRLPGSTPLNQSGLNSTRIALLGAGVALLLLVTVLVLRRRPDVS